MKTKVIFYDLHGCKTIDHEKLKSGDKLTIDNHSYRVKSVMYHKTIKKRNKTILEESQTIFVKVIQK